MNIVDLIRELQGYYTFKDLCTTLRRRGWTHIASGANKRVFWKQGQGCVIKVFKHRGGWYSDLSTCGIIHKKLVDYWLDNVYVCRRFTVQPAAYESVRYRKRAWKLLAKKMSESFMADWDIKEHNVGMYLGKPVIFDYGNWENPGPRNRKPTLRMKTIC